MNAIANTSAKDSIFSATRKPNEEWLARATPEAALEPSLPIIDPHVHFWHHKSGHRYFVEEFERDVAASGHQVEATVFVECNAMYRAHGPEHMKSVGETEFAAGMAAIAESGKYGATHAAAGIVAHANLMLGDQLQPLLDAHQEAAKGRLRGIRQRAKWDADPIVAGPGGAGQPGLLRQPQLHQGLKRLAAMDLVFEASIFHPQLPDVTALAKAHPDASIVVIHTASPLGFGSYADKQDQVHAEWLAGMRALAQCPNVSIKLGGLLMCLGNFDFSQAAAPPQSQHLAALWRPYIEPCIELFGADRCMASSNFPVEKAGVTYGTLWNTFKRITEGCSDDEKRLIFAGTARRIYRLD